MQVLATVQSAETTEVLATVRLAETADVHFLTYQGSRSPKTKVLIRGVGSLRPPSLSPDGCVLSVIILICGHRSHWIAQTSWNSIV